MDIALDHERVFQERRMAVSLDETLFGKSDRPLYG